MTAYRTFINKCQIPFRRNLMCFEAELYSEPCQISKIKVFAKMVNGFGPFFLKNAILRIHPSFKIG